MSLNYGHNKTMIYSEQILEKIGLSKQEILVYITGLKMGPSLASKIAREAKISRTLVYHLLESLTEKGLVNKSDSKNRKKFVMENPDRLKNILERKRKEFEKLEDQISSVSAELNSLYSPKQIPSKVYFYQGVERLKNMMTDILKTENHELDAFTSINAIEKIFDKEFMDYWLEEMEKKNITRKSIWSKPLSETRYTEGKNREIRVAPKGTLIDSIVLIYNNKVAVISSPDEPFAFVVEDKNFYNTMKSTFDALWKISAPSK